MSETPSHSQLPEHSKHANPLFALYTWTVEQLRTFLGAFGQMFLYLIDVSTYIFRGKINWHQTILQAGAIGADSLPVSVIICLIAGSVLTLQTAKKFAMTGANAYIGGLVAIAIVREIGPIFTCLAVGARAGTAIAAEIANMSVSEQISALQVMHVSPSRYLILPRLLGCMISIPLLTLIGEFVAIMGGMVLAQQVAHQHYSQFFESIWLNLTKHDLLVSMLKSAVFGILIVGICCTIGLRTRGGAKDVGLATTRAAVWSTIAIIVADFALSWIFFGTRFEQQF